MTMISSYDRPRSHNGLFYQRNLQSQCTIYLPVQLTPRYFGRQIQRKYPLVLWHMELPLHLCFPVAHSFTSAKQEVLLFGLPFFLYSCFRPWKEYRETVFSNQFDDCRQNWFQSESWLSTDCCSKYSYNSVIGLCPSYIPK